MRKSAGNVQKLDIPIPSTLLGRISGTLRRIQQTRETWTLSWWGIKASRERVETTTELASEASHERE
jgi:hypothetical protein